jgi:hypothetical protein
MTRLPLLFVMLLVAPNAANAGFVTCYTSNLVGSSACELGYAGSGAINTISSDNGGNGHFGITDWTLADTLGQAQGSGDGTLTLLSGLSGGTTTNSGVWALDTFGNFDDVMLVLMDNANPSYAAFLLNETTLSGAWNEYGLFGGDVVQMSVWYSASSGPDMQPADGVPEPGTSFLFAAGLVGLIGWRRKAL